MTALFEEAKTLIQNAYESILSRFPHYKAAFRVAQFAFAQNKFALAAETIVTHVFPPRRKPSPVVSGFEVKAAFD